VLALIKPGVTRSVTFTCAVGLWLAPSGGLTGLQIVLTLLGTALIIAGANVLNMYVERDLDGLMERTRSRPLPAGRVSPTFALSFGLALSGVALPVLFFGANPLTALLAALALAIYVLLYTPLKQRSWLAVWVGAVPGAIPPLMGWTAGTGRIGGPGLALFAIMFLWQVPHTLAITVFRDGDYRRAGYQTLPVQHGLRSTRWQTLLYSPLVVAASLLPVALGFGDRVYLASAVLLGVGFVTIAGLGIGEGQGVRWAKGLFAYSIVYITLLFGVLMATAGHLKA
jgi:protoheme IX farnesyltransferase